MVQWNGAHGHRRHAAHHMPSTKTPKRKTTKRKTPAKKRPRKATTSGGKKPRSPTAKKRTRRPAAKTTPRKAATPRPPAKTGRPRREFNLETVETLAKIGTTQKAMADAFGVGLRTIERRVAEDPEFRAALDRGRAEQEIALRGRLFEFAMDKTPSCRAAAVKALAILLGPYGVGERSTIEHQGTQVGIVFVIPDNGRVPVDQVVDGRDLSGRLDVLELPPPDDA